MIVPVGLYIRNQINETPVFARLGAARENSPVLRVMRAHGREVLSGLGLVILWTVCTYFFLIYMPTYSSRTLGLPEANSLLANSIGLAVIMVLAPVFGNLSDRVGRKPLLLTGAVAIAVVAYPAIAYLAAYPSIAALVSVQVVVAILIALFTGPAPAALAELFPENVRSSGMSLAYNFAVAIFGGFAPFIATWLVTYTGSNLAPAYYVVVAAMLSVVALTFMKETAGREAGQ